MTHLIRRQQGAANQYSSVSACDTSRRYRSGCRCPPNRHGHQGRVPPEQDHGCEHKSQSRNSGQEFHDAPPEGFARDSLLLGLGNSPSTAASTSLQQRSKPFFVRIVGNPRILRAAPISPRYVTTSHNPRPMFINVRVRNRPSDDDALKARAHQTVLQARPSNSSLARFKAKSFLGDTLFLPPFLPALRSNSKTSNGCVRISFPRPGFFTLERVDLRTAMLSTSIA
jgi:hypothetical protein